MTKILLVEDNELNLDMLSRRLSRRGYEICVATDGAEGVEIAQRELPQLILMDISLPVMDGYEATRILKAGTQTRHIPILGLSAHAMSGDADKAVAAGCDDYDTKPVELKRLLEKIEALLSRTASSPPAPPAVSAPTPPAGAGPASGQAGSVPPAAGAPPWRLSPGEPSPTGRSPAGGPSPAQPQRPEAPSSESWGFGTPAPPSPEPRPPVPGFTSAAARPAEGEAPRPLVEGFHSSSQAGAPVPPSVPPPRPSAPPPAVGPPPAPGLPAAGTSASPSARPSRGRILVAGISPERARKVSEQLRELGYEARLCGQAGSVELWLGEGRWDALVLDAASPLLDAPALIRRLRAAPVTRDLRILLVGTVDTMEKAFHCIRVGADFFLPFPFTNHLLELRLTSPRPSDTA